MLPLNPKTNTIFNPKAKFKIEFTREGYLMLARLFTKMHPAEWERQSQKLCAVTLYLLGQEMLKKAIDIKPRYKLTIDLKSALAFNELFLYLYDYTNDNFLKTLLDSILLESDRIVK